MERDFGMSTSLWASLCLKNTREPQMGFELGRALIIFVL